MWSSETITLALADPSAGGVRVYAERQARGGETDHVFGASGYRRLGDWTLAGGVAGGPDATFWFERAFDAEVSRRVAGTLVASAGYRHMRFPGFLVHQYQPALTWYNPRGEVQARLYATRNEERDRTTLALLVRSSVRVHPRLTLTGAVATGDRIFDIASLRDGNASAWTARGTAIIGITPRDGIEIGGGYAREESWFRQRTIVIAYRRLL